MDTLIVDLMTTPVQLAAFVAGLQPRDQIRGRLTGTDGAITLYVRDSASEPRSRGDRLNARIAARVAVEVVLQKVCVLAGTELALRNVHAEMTRSRHDARAGHLRAPLDELAKAYELSLRNALAKAIWTAEQEDDPEPSECATVELKTFSKEVLFAAMQGKRKDSFVNE